MIDNIEVDVFCPTCGETNFIKIYGDNTYGCTKCQKVFSIRKERVS